MRAAIPLFGSRVSPRCLYANEVLLAEIKDTRLVARTVTDLGATEEATLVEALGELGVDQLVCGGIGRELAAELEAHGIAVTCNVAGEADEVLEALRKGELRSGHGLRAGQRPPLDDAAESITFPRVDCLACASRACLQGEACLLASGALPAPVLRGEEARLYETGRDVSAQSEPKLCRIAELVHFGVDLGYRRIGVAYCSELTEETETLVCVLRRFFDVVPVCCHIATRGNDRSDVTAPEIPSCNPVAQARVLAQARTELNVIAGLCLGCDLLFTARSHAPVTTLFVKDRLLAHNPIGAIYTRYHLEDLERNRPGSPLARAGSNT